MRHKIFEMLAARFTVGSTCDSVSYSDALLASRQRSVIRFLPSSPLFPPPSSNSNNFRNSKQTKMQLLPPAHLLFVVLTALYAPLANLFILRTNHIPPPSGNYPPSISPLRTSARLLFPFTFIFSLLTPSLLLLLSPRTLSPILFPHLFLMLAQILMEFIGFSLYSFFTLYIRLAVTIAFVAYRLPVILRWYDAALNLAKAQAYSPNPSSLPALAQATALLNLVFWSFALFCFLLLYCLPAVCREPSLNAKPSAPVTT